jgi:hypothetical protein
MGYLNGMRTEDLRLAVLNLYLHELLASLNLHAGAASDM